MRAIHSTIIALAALVPAPAAATTRWLITDPDKSSAVRVATEQAMQKAAADRSCYRPALPRQCTRGKGAWTCMAENPTSPSDCGRRGRWKTALSSVETPMR